MSENTEMKQKDTRLTKNPVFENGAIMAKPSNQDLKAMAGKIDMQNTVSSVCACGCSCWNEDDFS